MPDQIARQRRFWDRRADENPMYFIDNTLDYGRPNAPDFWAHGESELHRLLDAVGAELRPTDEVVEIGCGIGRMTRAIARRAHTVRALDISPHMLDGARELAAGLRGVEWVLGDGVSLAGIGDESADVCLSHVVFQHIPDPAVTLGYVREIGRVLRPGGWAAFQVSNDPSIHHRRRGREGVRIRWWQLSGRGPRGQAHPSWLGSAVSLADLRAAAADGGTEVRRIAGEATQLCFVLAVKPGG